MDFKKIGFIGLGLIGGSLAKTIKRIYPETELIATSGHLSTITAAFEDHTISNDTLLAMKDFSDCDIIFLCCPVQKNIEYIKELIDIPKMSDMCSQMLEDLNNAFLEEDAELAYEIALRDKELDRLYLQIRDDSLKAMHRNPEDNINQGVRLLFVGRYLERIGDHITNICEKIIYAKKGTMVEIG